MLKKKQNWKLKKLLIRLIFLLRMKKLAIKELKNQVSLISMQIAEKVIKKELDNTNKQEEFLNKLIDETNIK